MLKKDTSVFSTQPLTLRYPPTGRLMLFICISILRVLRAFRVKLVNSSFRHLKRRGSYYLKGQPPRVDRSQFRPNRVKASVMFRASSGISKSGRLAKFNAASLGRCKGSVRALMNTFSWRSACWGRVPVISGRHHPEVRYRRSLGPSFSRIYRALHSARTFRV